jgi:hypothetical protein
MALTRICLARVRLCRHSPRTRLDKNAFSIRCSPDLALSSGECTSIGQRPQTPPLPWQPISSSICRSIIVQGTDALVRSQSRGVSVLPSIHPSIHRYPGHICLSTTGYLYLFASRLTTKYVIDGRCIRRGATGNITTNGSNIWLRLNRYGTCDLLSRGMYEGTHHRAAAIHQNARNKHGLTILFGCQ